MSSIVKFGEYGIINGYVFKSIKCAWLRKNARKGICL